MIEFDDDIRALVLAAGKGTRMYSARPKVMQEILGEPMLWYVYHNLEQLFAERIHTVVGYQAQVLEAAFPERSARFIHQAEQLGTGHALQVAWAALKDQGAGELVVVNGDTPLLSVSQLRSFVDMARVRQAALSFMTLQLADPGSFGRVVRSEDGSVAIVEAKDYQPEAHGPVTGEINAGIYYFRMDQVAPLLSKLSDQNKSREYYITDLVGLSVQAGLTVSAEMAGDDLSFLGINNPLELVRTEEELRRRTVDSLLAEGVLIHNKDMVRIGPKAQVERGAELTGPCEVYGRSRIASGATVESHVWMKDSTIETGTRVRSFCHLEEAEVGPGCAVGPYARLRPGTILEDGARVGNFVETKKAVLRRGAKANHLTYLGDAEVGAGANIGAGTITCNYDGKSKHKTTIGQGAFIGSNTALVAPVSVGDEALVGAGSVIRKNVPDKTLAVARGEQKNYPRRPKP